MGVRNLSISILATELRRLPGEKYENGSHKNWLKINKNIQIGTTNNITL